jgi:proteasome alpha subunit
MAPGLRTGHRAESSLTEALHLAVNALASVGGEGGQPRTLTASQLEVAVLDRRRSGRTFRRITGTALTALLDTPPVTDVELPADEPGPEPESPATQAAPEAATEPTETPTEEPPAEQ